MVRISIHRDSQIVSMPNIYQSLGQASVFENESNVFDINDPLLYTSLSVEKFDENISKLFREDNDTFGNFSGNYSYINDTEFIWGDTLFPSGYSTIHIIISSIILTLIMIVVVVGNMLVIIAIATEKALKNIQNWFIASLAVSDFFVGLIVMPFSLANELMGYWIFGNLWCDIHSALDVMLCTASILNICMISLDRYWSITKAIEYLKTRTPMRATIMIGSVWIMSALISIPPLLGWREERPPAEYPTCQVSEDIGYVMYSALGSFYIPSCIMVFVYIRIYFAAKARARRGIKRPQKPKPSATDFQQVSATPPPSFVQEKSTTTTTTTTSFSVTSVGPNKNNEGVSTGSLKKKKQVQLNIHMSPPSPVPEIKNSSNEPKSNPNQELLIRLPLDNENKHILTISEQSSAICLAQEHMIDSDSDISPPQSPSGIDSDPISTPPPHSPGMPCIPTVTCVHVTSDEDSTHSGNNNSLHLENNNCGSPSLTRLENGETLLKAPPVVLNSAPGLQTLQVENPQTSPLRGSTLSINGDINIMSAISRCSSRMFENECSDVDPSSSDSGTTTRGCSKPLKLRLCHPMFGKKSSKSKREVIDVGKVPQKPRDPEREKRRIARKKEKRATLILGLIMGSFILCWLPFFFLYIFTPMCEICNMPGWAFAIAFWLGYMNSALNPVIYTIFNKDFRRAFRRILFK